MRYFFELNPYNQQRQFEKPVWVYPAHLAMYATHLKQQGHDVAWGEDGYTGILRTITVTSDDQIDVPFEQLPIPDREFTDAKNPRWQAYGNYRWHPATHMMASNLCWYGKCTFCIDTAKLAGGDKRGVRHVNHVMEEIDDCIRLGYKEIFDDSGTFPVGKWLEDFCFLMGKTGRYGSMKPRREMIKLGCNMKPVSIDYKMMAKAGFRFILVGVESFNQETLDRICKGQKAVQTIDILKEMNAAGLYVHLTSMFGYEWETEYEADYSLRMIHELLKKGIVKTAQASVYSPPRTKPDPDSLGHKYVSRVYDVVREPEFWYHKIKDTRCWEDLKYLLRGGRLVVEEKIRKMGK